MDYILYALKVRKVLYMLCYHNNCLHRSYLTTLSLASFTVLTKLNINSKDRIWCSQWPCYRPQHSTLNVTNADNQPLLSMLGLAGLDVRPSICNTNADFFSPEAMPDVQDISSILFYFILPGMTAIFISQLRPFSCPDSCPTIHSSPRQLKCDQ